MKVFQVACIDDKSGYEMVLSECSYNMACSWIESKFHPNSIKVDETDYIYITIPGIEFIYDENRSYLMRR